MSVSEPRTQKQSALDKEVAEDLAFFAKEIEYFETHDISEELAASPEVHFEISPSVRRKRYPLDDELSEKLAVIARQRGVPAEDLLNQWVREKAAESQTVGAAK